MQNSPTPTEESITNGKLDDSNQNPMTPMQNSAPMQTSASMQSSITPNLNSTSMQSSTTPNLNSTAVQSSTTSSPNSTAPMEKSIGNADLDDIKEELSDIKTQH